MNTTDYNEDSIAISLIKAQIERCKHTIAAYTGDENIGVRISARSKMSMLEDIIKNTNESRVSIGLPPISIE